MLNICQMWHRGGCGCSYAMRRTAHTCWTSVRSEGIREQNPWGCFWVNLVLRLLIFGSMRQSPPSCESLNKGLTIAHNHSPSRRTSRGPFPSHGYNTVSRMFSHLKKYNSIPFIQWHAQSLRLLILGIYSRISAPPSSIWWSPPQLVTSPDAVEDVSISGDPQQLVVCGNLVEVGSFLVSKEQVRLPDGVQHGGVQVQGIIRVFVVRQPWVIPLLSQEDVHPVILHGVSREQRNTVSAQGRLKLLRNGGHVLKLLSKPNI